jgi:hypothetical protein
LTGVRQAPAWVMMLVGFAALALPADRLAQANLQGRVK